MARRVPITLTDYLVVGINPALIMLLVASLIFFLVDVVYQGDYNLRLKFIFFMFIMGAVATGRLSMEQGSGYAAAFALPLGVVAFIGINAFVAFEGSWRMFSPLINLVLLGLIWLLAHMLTWDCTVLDDRTDTADQGLLAAMAATGTGSESAESTEEVVAPNKRTPAASLPEWLAWLEQLWARHQRPHAHGIWILYFACLALPLFGVLGWFLPRSASVRQQAFGALVLYVASSLALLVATSFLGLRRYLRLRQVEMPPSMTAVWLSAGGVVIVAVLVGCLVLPRPGAEVAASRIPFAAFTNSRTPSRWNVGNDGQQRRDDARSSSQSGRGEQNSDNDTNAQGDQPKPGQGQSDADAPSGENAGSKSGEAGQGDQAAGQQGSASQGSSSGTSQSQGGQSGSGNSPGGESSESKQQEDRQSKASNKPKNGAQEQEKKSEQRSSSSAQKSADKRSADKPTSGTQRTSQGSGSSSSSWSLGGLFAWIGTLFKVLFWLALLVVAGYYAWQHREALRQAWQQLCEELRAFWNRWFGPPEPQAVSVPLPVVPPSYRRFASFSDPFTTVGTGQWSPRQVVQHTFAALEAYGREAGLPRQEHETPHEYGERLGDHLTQLSPELQQLLEWYGVTAYSSRPLPEQYAGPIRRLWRKWADPSLHDPTRFAPAPTPPPLAEQATVP